MRGAPLIIRFLTAISLCLASIMVILNLYPSWSQYARTMEESLLLATLPLIASIFLIRSFTHPDREKILYRVIWDVKMKHVSRYTALAFWGINWTPVTIGVWWIETLHFIFTISGIILAYTEVVTLRKKPLFGMIGFGLAVIGMVVGFWFKWWSLGVGEMIATLPIAYHVWTTNKGE